MGHDTTRYAKFHDTTSSLPPENSCIDILGFLLWNIDNNVCTHITHFREVTLLNGNIATFLSPLTQLHGWWHIMAGYATYLYILNCIQHRLHFLGIEWSLKMRWFGPTIQLMPDQRLKLSKSHYYQD